MNREEIISAVEKYIQDDDANYAVMIDGSWGSGKTYIYKEYISHRIDDLVYRKTGYHPNVYISLYGVSSIEALSKQLISLFYSSHLNDENAQNFAVKTGGVIAAVCRSVTLSVSCATVDLGELLDGISQKINLSNMVICFDDFERANININEVLGYIDNLVEHCGCKVLILADEANIGKVFSNTNVEQKYQTVLNGGRLMVVDANPNESVSEINDRINKGLYTPTEIKQLSEKLFSDNYLYRDIKEKVVQKTFAYTPSLNAILAELINGNEKRKGIAGEGGYKDFLNLYSSTIYAAFSEMHCSNVRIIKSWIKLYEEIYKVTESHFLHEKNYDDIVREFLHYCIWAYTADRKNEPLVKQYYRKYSVINKVSIKGHEDISITSFYFIDKFIRSGYLDVQELCQEAKDILKRCAQEDFIDGKNKCIQDEKCALRKIRNWRYMPDDSVRLTVEEMINELENGVYSFPDFGLIMLTLDMLNEYGLCFEDLEQVQKKMLDLIDEKDETYSEDEIDYYLSEGVGEARSVMKLVSPIIQKQIQRNKEIDRNKVNEQNIYDDADAFSNHCDNMKNFYLERQSFIGYIDMNKLIALLNESDLRGVYKIATSIRRLYKLLGPQGLINDAPIMRELLEEFDNSVKVYEITMSLAISEVRNEIVKVANYNSEN